MLTGIVVVLFGVGGIVIGGLQLAGVLPRVRRTGGAFSAYMNLVMGVFLIVLGALRLKGLL